MQIKKIIPRMILDSRGFPTIECDIYLETPNAFGRASVPSGASTGKNEALELRDKDLEHYQGKGVENAISNINNIIAPNLYGKKFETFAQIDKVLCELDGTSNKSKLGANTILSVSLAFAHAVANAKAIPLYQLIADEFGYKTSELAMHEAIMPKPMFNVINGGAHADNNLDIQEFMIMPQFDDYRKNLKACCEIVYSLKKLLQDKGYATNVGDEGGFAPQLNSNSHALDLIAIAVEQASYKFGVDVKICLDVASSEFYIKDDSSEGKYVLKHENKTLTAEEMVEFYRDLCFRYPIFSIEDAMSQDDIAGWQKCTKVLCNSHDIGQRLQLVGDDVFVTNPSIFGELSEQGIANSILIKPNQIGTLSETLEVIKMAKNAGYSTVISHRSGETEDATIAHIAVGARAGQIKTGAPVRTDRNAKFNELLRIMEGL